MGPMNDDDDMMMRPAATPSVRSDPPKGPAAAGGDVGDPAEAGGITDQGDPADNDGPGVPVIEEAGYGYGV